MAAPAFKHFDYDFEILETAVKNWDRRSVQREDNKTKVAAGRMSEVDFISYRDDRSSSIGCGPLKSPAAIYLTYRADATKSHLQRHGRRRRADWHVDTNGEVRQLLEETLLHM